MQNGGRAGIRRGGLNNNADIRFAAGQGANHFKAADESDIEVRYDDLERLVMLIQKSEGFVAVGRIVGLQTRADENGSERHTELRVVIDDKNLKRFWCEG